jgi:hypothetical protein
MRISQHLAALLGAATLACSSAPPEPTSGLFTIRVFNGSSIALTNVEITTAEGISFREPRLEHGEMSRPHYVDVMHSAPLVTVRADGQTLVSNPTEGFGGFNPKLAPGAYVIDLVVSSDQPRRVTVSVTQPVEN